MNVDIPVTSTPQQRQETFWMWTDTMVKRLVTDLAEKVLQLELEGHLGAGWNHRTKARSDYRNGYYYRRLATPYGPVQLRVPRCRSGRFDAESSPA